MTKVGILGMGHVGSDVAYSLCQSKLVSELLLFDQNMEKVTAEALELKDAMVAMGHHVSILVQDYDTLADTDIIIISVGSQSIDNEDRHSELADNLLAIDKEVPKLVEHGFKGLFIVISNPCDVVTMHVQKVSGFPCQRVIGTGTSLDTYRMKRVVGQYFNVSPLDVEGFVLGEHGESQFIAWSTVRVQGQSVTKDNLVNSQKAFELQEATRLGGWHIHQGKGWTSYGIAATTTRLIQAIILNEKRVFPVSVYDELEEMYAGYPAIIGREGILSRIELTLPLEEQLAYKQSIEVIRRSYAK